MLPMPIVQNVPVQNQADPWVDLRLTSALRAERATAMFCRTYMLQAAFKRPVLQLQGEINMIESHTEGTTSARISQEKLQISSA